MRELDAVELHWQRTVSSPLLLAVVQLFVFELHGDLEEWTPFADEDDVVVGDRLVALELDAGHRDLDAFVLVLHARLQHEAGVRL